MIHLIYEIKPDKTESVVGYVMSKPEAKAMMARLGKINPDNNYCSVEVERL